MDKMIHMISNKHNAIVVVVDTTNSVQEIIDKHQTDMLASLVIAKVTIATTLLGFNLKNKEDKIISIMNGQGPIGTVMAEFTNGKIRAFCSNPQIDVSDFDSNKDYIKQAVGINGNLKIIKSFDLKESYTSLVDLTAGDINLDFAYYLLTSEQIKSLITSSVELDENGKVKHAIGLLVQLLPNHQEEDIVYLENKIEELKNLKNISDIQTYIDIIDKDMDILDTKELKFECSCSEQKALSTIQLLDDDQIKEMLTENKQIEIICDFCRQKYDFSPTQIINIKKKN